MRDDLAVLSSQRSPIPLWRSVSHGGEELKGGKKGINTDSFSRKTVEIDGLWRREVSKVAAHEVHIRFGYVVVPMRTRQEVGAQALDMARHVACLRGWHPALGRAEIAALLPMLETERLNGRRLVALTGDAPVDDLNAAVEVSSGCQAILCNAIVWDHQQNSSLDALIDSIVDHLGDHPRTGTVAVRAWRHEGRIKDVSPSRLAQRIGGRLHDQGYSIDLEAPEHRFGVVIDASSNTIVCGWMLGYGEQSDGLAVRKAAERPFFKPVSLDPRLARLAVNLASGPVKNGTTVDLMCGTGGFLIEAALSKRSAIGIDLDQMMVDGTKQNLEWALAAEHQDEHKAMVLKADATSLGEVAAIEAHRVVGFVLDPPYGRNSQGSLEPLALLEQVLLSASSVAHPQAGLVLILPMHPMGEHPNEELQDGIEVNLLHGEWSDVQRTLQTSHWSIQGRWAEHVHASLSRLILHATVVPQD